MDNILFDRLQIAKRKNDLNGLTKIYNECPNNHIIKCEYAKMLVNSGKEDNKVKGRKLLIELFETKSRNYAILELGKLEMREGHFNSAREYFNKLLNTESEKFAYLQLGLLEKIEGNYKNAKEYLMKSLNKKNADYIKDILKGI